MEENKKRRRSIGENTHDKSKRRRLGASPCEKGWFFKLTTYIIGLERMLWINGSRLRWPATVSTRRQVNILGKWSSCAISIWFVFGTWKPLKSYFIISNQNTIQIWVNKQIFQFLLPSTWPRSEFKRLPGLLWPVLRTFVYSPNLITTNLRFLQRF